MIDLVKLLGHLTHSTFREKYFFKNSGPRFVFENARIKWNSEQLFYYEAQCSLRA